MNLLNYKRFLLALTIIIGLTINVNAQNHYYPETVYYVNADQVKGPKKYNPEYAGAWEKSKVTTNTMYTKDCPCYNKKTTGKNGKKHLLTAVENLGSVWKIYEGTCGETYTDVNKGLDVSHRSLVNANVTIASPWFSISETQGALVAQWDFTAENPLVDRQGNFGELKRMKGAPAATAKGLELNNGQYLTTTGNVSLTEKTIYARAIVKNIQVRGGALLSLLQPNRSDFDAIVLGEIEAGKLLAGSHNWCRTGTQNPGIYKNNEEVNIAISYKQLNATTFKVTVYMNGAKIYDFENKTGEIYGKHCGANGELPTYVNPMLLIGPRHLVGNTDNPAGGISVIMEEARIYNIALSEADARALTHL